MPKKTKSQKIITELRRQLAGQGESLSRAKKTVEKPSLTLPKQEIEQGQRVSPFAVSDLKKSLFLCLLAISLELVLYYLLELA